MPLYDPERKVTIEPSDAIVVVHDFLLRCQKWAERDIPRRLEAVAGDLKPEDSAKLHSWVSYLRFTEHAITELEKGELDHWFTGRADAENEAL